MKKLLIILMLLPFTCLSAESVYLECDLTVETLGGDVKPIWPLTPSLKEGQKEEILYWYVEDPVVDVILNRGNRSEDILFMHDAFKEDGCMFTNTDLICKSYKETKKKLRGQTIANLIETSINRYTLRIKEMQKIEVNDQVLSLVIKEGRCTKYSKKQI